MLHYVYIVFSTYIKPTSLFTKTEQFLRNTQSLCSPTNVAFLMNANCQWSAQLSATGTRHWQTSNSNLCILNFRVRKGTIFNAFIRNMSWLEPRPGHWLFWLSFKWFSSVSIKKHSEVHLRIKNCSSTNLLKIYQFSYNFAPYMPVWVTAWLSKHKTKYSQSFRPLILLVTIYTSCTVNMKDYTITRRKSTYLPVTVNMYVLYILWQPFL